MRFQLRVFSLCGVPSCGAEPPATPDVVQADLPSAVAIVSSTAGASASAPPVAGAMVLPELYAALFVEGRRWPLALTFVVTQWDEAQKKNDESTTKGTASCEVSEVLPMAEGLQARIDCQGVEDNGVPQPIAGWWFATKKGLFHAGPSETFDDAVLIMEPVPKPRVEKTEPKEEPDFGSKITVKRSGSAWCHESVSWGGDEGWSQVCLKPGVGFQSGNWGWSGGSTHETLFVLAE